MRHMCKMQNKKHIKFNTYALFFMGSHVRRRSLYRGVMCLIGHIFVHISARFRQFSARFLPQF